MQDPQLLDLRMGALSVSRNHWIALSWRLEELVWTPANESKWAKFFEFFLISRALCRFFMI